MDNNEVIKILKMHRDTKTCDVNCTNDYPRECEVCEKAFDIAIKALDNKKSKKVKKGKMVDYMGYYCPHCNQELVWNGEWDFCMWCGNALKW